MSGTKAQTHADTNLDPPKKPPATGSALYDPNDDSWTRWRNTFNLLLGRFDEENFQKYVQMRDKRHEKADCMRCEGQRDFLLAYSPIIRFMQGKISALGGDLHAGNIQCRSCPTGQGGGFDPEYGILLCANKIRKGKRSFLEDTMAHEMVHAYDHLRFKMDPVDNLRHAACTEIRASSLSGECRFMREFFTNRQWNITQHHQECVRRRAVLSVMNRPTCKDDVQAAQVVNEVWDSCFPDTRPFDEIYK